MKLHPNVEEKRKYVEETIATGILDVRRHLGKVFMVELPLLNDTNKATVKEVYNKLSDIFMKEISDKMPIDKEFIRGLGKRKTIIEMDSHDFDMLVEKVYGTPYEIVAEEEMHNGSIKEFNLVDDIDLHAEVYEKEKIRKGEYGQYNTYLILECMLEDGYLEEAIYQIKADW